MRTNMHFFVHDLPLTPHQRERTKKKRHLVTEIEQRRLLGTKIGFIRFLSTGSVALKAFLREGIGCINRIVDFDSFETSSKGNYKLSRVASSTSGVRSKKVNLCIECIKSMDQCIKVEPFPKGLSEKNVSEFVQYCRDIIVILEECHDFAMNLMVREVFKRYRRPALMATSENGFLDVERYDTADPFHVVVDQTSLKAFKLPDLSAAAGEEKENE